MNVELIFTVTCTILAGLSLILVYKIFKGPTVIERVIAADCIDIMLGVVIILFGCIQDSDVYIDIGLIVILVGFIGTILISRYLEGTI